MSGFVRKTNRIVFHVLADGTETGTRVLCGHPSPKYCLSAEYANDLGENDLCAECKARYDSPR